MAKPLKVKKLAPDGAGSEAAARILRTRLKEFFSHWRDLDAPPTGEQLHNLRISGKRLRYSAEMLRAFYPDRLALLLDLLKRVQDALGEVQDYETERRMLEAEVRRLEARLRHESQPPKLKSVKSIKGEVEALRAMLDDGRRKQDKLFAAFSRLWRGLSHKKMRATLRHVVSRPTA
jgi:CHAD domain-containing protein